MPPFVLPDQCPDAATILTSLDLALCRMPHLDPLLRAAAREYVSTLASPTVVDASSTLPASQIQRYDDIEARVKEILKQNNEPSDHVQRFKRPTGPITARAGNLLFYPPPTNKPSVRDTLVRGPDTTRRMLDAGLSDAGLFTLDMYPFSTKIPRKSSASCSPFTWDDTFENSNTAAELWKIFTIDASAAYLERAVLPGLEIVWGAPVKQLYNKATSTLPSGWHWLICPASIEMPAISIEDGSFPSGTYFFKFVSHCLVNNRWPSTEL